MRHNIVGNKLGRNSSWRKATIRDIARATLIRQRICTTKAKAKEARKLVDRLITLGKKGTLAHRRKAFSILNDHQLVSELFRKTAPRFKTRNGGYTRIIPLSLRRGDNAQLAYLELTEKEEIVISKAKSAATSKVKDVKTDTPLPAAATKPGAKPKDEPAPKAQAPRAVLPKTDKGKDKLKSGQKFVGGIKKMFQRKTGGE